jgi:HEAT repeat protein
LDSVDLERRVILIQFLGLLNDPRVVVPILKSGRDEAVEDLAEATLQSLAALLPLALERVWNELDEDLKIRACAALARDSGEVADRLLGDALANGGIQLRCVAADAIGRGGFFDRLPELVRRLESSARTDDVESDEEVIAIGRAIVELAEHPEAVHTGIDVHLIEILSSRLAGAAEPVRLAIAKVLGRLGRDQDQDIIRYLLKDESAAVRRAAVHALARFDFERSVDALRLAMGDEASMVRIAAATVLGNSNRPEAVEPLARQMEDEDPRVVAVATRSIGRLYRGLGGDLEQAKDLIEHALSCEALVALAAIEALTDVGGEMAAELVVPTLQRPEADVVRSGVACLGAFADRDALAEILPLVAHPDWSVRAEAVQVFADRRYRKGLPALLRRLEVEDDAFVREVILRTVERLED